MYQYTVCEKHLLPYTIKVVFKTCVLALDCLWLLTAETCSIAEK
jgi:hypothetical protein